jgi:peptidyl-tRNA hydrolase, PTH1 family
LVGFFTHKKPEPELAYLIVGLGNPGREYRMNRHNAGFMVIDRICDDFGIRIGRMQSKALIGLGKIEGCEGANGLSCRLILAKPQTFMNLSGQAVSGLLHYYKVSLDRMVIIHDDMDLPFGTLRMRPGGGSAGQKGLQSTIQQLGTQNFPRLRIGVGRPPGQMAPPDYLLQDFNKAEQETLPVVLERASHAVRTFMTAGLDAAMNQYNGALQEG